MRLNLFRILFSLGIVVYLLSPELPAAKSQPKVTATATDGTEYVIDNQAEEHVVVKTTEPGKEKTTETTFSSGQRVEEKVSVRNKNGDLISVKEITFDDDTGKVSRVTTVTHSSEVGQGWSSQTVTFGYDENGDIKKTRRYESSNDPAGEGRSKAGSVEFDRDGEIVKAEGNIEGITDDLSLNDNQVHIMIEEATGMVVIIRHTPEGRIDITRIINGAIVEQSTFTCPNFGDCPISQTEAGFLDEVISQDEPVVYGIRIRQVRLLDPGMGSGNNHGGGHY